MSNALTFSSFVQASQGLTDYSPLTLEGDKLSFRSWGVKDYFIQPQEQNRKVVQAFKEVLLAHYGQRRVDRICRKYHLDIDSLIKTGSPLLPSHIDTISIGVSEVFTKDLCEEGGSKAKWLTPQQIHAKVEKLREHAFTKENDRFSFWRLPIISSLIRGSLLSFDQKKSMLWPKLSGISYQTYVETLSKRIGGLEPEDGSLIPAPSSQGTDYFKVYKRIVKDGLVAYALKPVSSFSLLRPLIVFRPTSTTLAAHDAPQTWLTDFELRIGSSGYLEAKNELSALMADPDFCPPGKKVDVTGYSLGAVHTQRFLADQWKRVDRAFCFNGPSVESSLAEKFARDVNATPSSSEEAAFSIQVFRTRDDLAHQVGDKHIGWGVSHPKVHREVLEVDFIERPMETRFSVRPYLTRHVHLFLLDRSSPFVAQRHQKESIDMQLDNTSFGSAGKYWEGLRVTLGSLFLYPLILVIHKVALFSHKYFHVSLFTYSAQRYDYFSFFRSRLVSLLPSGSESIS